MMYASPIKRRPQDVKIPARAILLHASSHDAALSSQRACAGRLYVTAGRSETERDPWTNVR